MLISIFLLAIFAALTVPSALELYSAAPHPTMGDEYIPDGR